MPTARTFQLDIDTKRYLARVNVYRKLNGLGNLLPPDIADIDNFVVGLKDLGVWSNFMCYMLRPKYNIGAGNSAASIGGSATGAYGRFASLVSASSTYPTWSQNGIMLTATNQGITTNINQGKIFGVNAFYSSVFFMNTATNEGYRIITCDIPATGFGCGVDDFDATYVRWLNTGGAGNVPKSLLTSFQFMSFGKGTAPNGSKGFVGNTSYGSTTSNLPVTSPTSNINIGGRDLSDVNGNAGSVASKLQTNAFFMAGSIHLTFEQHKSVYALLKSSIMKDLPLP